MNLADLNRFIHAHCGLFFDGENAEQLDAALRRRMTHTGEATLEAYHARLLADGEEFHELVSLLTINETYFYREPEQLRLLTDKLLPRLLARREDGSPIRIFSAGCSSGEEPYSIAIALREKYGESAARLFALSGGDIDRQALARARAARYSPFSFRTLTEELRERHFHRETTTANRWEVKPEVRKMVELHPFNLLADSAGDEAGSVDVIFFRNVSIYFDQPTRRTIQARLKGLLRPGGMLVVSSSETLANDFGLMPLVEDEGHFYFVNAAPETAPAAPRSTARPAARLPTRPAAQSQAQSRARPARPTRPPQATPTARPAVRFGEDPLAKATALVREKRHDQALPLIEELITARPSEPAAHLLKAHILAHRKAFEQAEEVARQALEHSPWCDEAFLLLGMIAKWRGRADEATQWFRQAIYTRPDCWAAHYQLADLYRAGGDAAKAGREYRLVLQQLTAGAPQAGVLPIDYPVAEVRLLCERHLANLTAAPTAHTPR